MIPADCAFPTCRDIAITDAGMCDLHQKVSVASSGSWVDDVHREGGHG